jgi:hypothetical protein
MACRWGSPLNWRRARRHLVATWLVETTDRKRQRWGARHARRTGARDFALTIPDLPAEFSCIVLGEPGEGDAAQRVLVEKVLKEAADTAFTISASDVIYPAGRPTTARNSMSPLAPTLVISMPCPATMSGMTN